MVKKYYIDTCIWIDYFEDRKDKFRPLGDWAFELIKNIIENEDLFVISDLLIKELKRFYSIEKIKRLFEFLPKKLIYKIKVLESQKEEARGLKRKLNIPFNDILHLIIAKDENAVLVTRDKHLLKLFWILNIKKPEELI